MKCQCNAEFTPDRKVSVVVLGTRGIPEVQGGIESHCQKLFPRLAKIGFDVTIFARSGYVKVGKKGYVYQGVRVYPKKCSHKATLESITHTLRCFFCSFKKRPDIVHIHAIGPALFIPLFRLTGAKVIYTHHGQDYMRAKWGTCAKFVLRMGEKIGTKFSHKIIVISEYLDSFLKTTYKTNKTILIRNGVEIHTEPIKHEHTYLEKFGLNEKKYILACGRFVEEKGFHDLIAAYKLLPNDLKEQYKLVIAGRPDHKSSYAEKLIKEANDSGVVLTGFISGDELFAIQKNARLFCIPSYHEGLPIALLEALSYNLDVVASDIPANTEVPLPRDCFAKVGNVEHLSTVIKDHLEKEISQNFVEIIEENYNWDKIAEETSKVYQSLVYGT